MYACLYTCTPHTSIHRPVLPDTVLIARQHASVVEEDATFFKTMVYGTEKLIFLTTVVCASVGAFLVLVGLSLILFQALQVKHFLYIVTCVCCTCTLPNFHIMGVFK